MPRSPKPDATMATTRTEAYTDAVFAIAATLLVLDLTADSIGKIDSDGQLWQALGDMSQNIVGFVISFWLLSMLWVIHLRQFRDIVRVDTVLLWLNNARLLFIVLIPFTTSLAADYFDWYAGRMLLPINFFFAALFGHLSWRWAASRGGHLLRDQPESETRLVGLGGLAAVICGGIAAGVSPWIGSWGFLAYWFSGPITTLLARITRTPEGQDAAPGGAPPHAG
ncbi:TMEM175 family protein [Microbacterium sp. LRZ72]|uniref:TMEM175 family protein n=1 Tax=Microbacterium sp. LRZ72 TaxID=2942481 RepID=UPI0029B6FDA3|nr:TMEM175 family protein [Microbacterium sp. LRZ72]MDX2377240.1 TMEM175 family protein [Microbacterium sp. LRZ72]